MQNLMEFFSTWLSNPDPWKVFILYCLFNNITSSSDYMTSNDDKKNTEF